MCRRYFIFVLGGKIVVKFSGKPSRSLLADNDPALVTVSDHIEIDKWCASDHVSMPLVSLVGNETKMRLTSGLKLTSGEPTARVFFDLAHVKYGHPIKKSTLVCKKIIIHHFKVSWMHSSPQAAWNELNFKSLAWYFYHNSPTCLSFIPQCIKCGTTLK